jgi:NDP-sugar pyrophosphorylase family protein
MKCSFVVPSAGFAKRLYPLSSSVPKILIRLNGVPLFSLLYRQALDYGCANFIVAISQEFERQVKEFVENNYANAPIPIIIRVVDNPTAGVLYSVKVALDAPEIKEYALIVLSDTFYNAPLPTDDSFVIYSHVDKPLNRWCLISTVPVGRVSRREVVLDFYDKPEGEVNTDCALIGVYKVNSSSFTVAANAVLYGGAKLRGEFQLSQAFVKYLLTEGEISAIQAIDGAWHDTGTLDTLRKASNDFFLSRCFNHIKIKDGMLFKSSSKKDVIQKQYLWYQNFTHKNLIPAIYDYSEKPESAQIKMELCAMPDLGTYFNYCNAEPVFFEQTIEYLLNKMSSTLWLGVKELVACNFANHEMFVKKTLERISECGNQFDFNFVTDDFVSDLEILASKSYCTQIHGDFILSNILFDPQRMTFKLIDPRGQYGKLGMFGDVRYELAKLLHSVDGKYEAIIHNLYTIEGDEVVFYMSDKKKKCFDAAKKVIYNFAVSEYGIPERELKVLEASLFLSMIPLHSESKSHQQAFYLTGKRLVKELYENRV